MALATAPSASASGVPCEPSKPQVVNAAALRPADVLLAISAPRAGETIVEAPADDSISLTVDYWGPRLVAANAAHAVDEYHLAYFLDDDASAYLGSLSPIPRCDPHIVHTAETRVTFDHVAHGSHTLQVVLSGSNDVSVNPPVATSVTFMVR